VGNSEGKNPVQTVFKAPQNTSERQFLIQAVRLPRNSKDAGNGKAMPKDNSLVG